MVLFVNGVLFVQVRQDIGEPGLGGFLSILEVFLLLFIQGFGASSLLFKGVHSVLSVGFVGLSLGFSDILSVGVQFIHELFVLEGVFLLQVMGNKVLFDGGNDRLNFIGVDDSGNISVGHNRSFQFIVRFLFTGSLEGSENIVQSHASGLSPDDESTQLSSGGQGLEVQSVDISDFNTRDVSESLNEFDVFVSIDDEGSFLDLVSFVSQFSFSSSQGLGVNDLLDVFVGSEFLQESDSLVGLFERFKSIFNHEGHFGDLVNLVSSGHNQGGQGSSGQSRGDGVSSLLDVDLSVPSSVGLEGEGHSTLSDHVTEGGLSSSGGTGSRNSGNSGDGTTGSPGFGGVFHTSFGVDSVGLSSIFR